MEFLTEYGLFFAKVITIVIAIIVVLVAITAQAVKSKGDGPIFGHIDVQNINKHFESFEEQIFALPF